MSRRDCISFQSLGTTPLLTKVEVATLVFGLEETAPCLGVHISPLLHQQLHVVLAPSFDRNVQGGLA